MSGPEEVKVRIVEMRFDRTDEGVIVTIPWGAFHGINPEQMARLLIGELKVACTIRDRERKAKAEGLN